MAKLEQVASSEAGSCLPYAGASQNLEQPDHPCIGMHSEAQPDGSPNPLAHSA